jgi:tripeptide aminopeptidase
MTEARLTAVQEMVTRIAGERAVHAAMRYFHAQEQQFRRWQIELTGIAAPQFGETARGAWLAARFGELGLSDVTTDKAGNVLGWLRGASDGEERRQIVFAAHLDTVFSAATLITVRHDGDKLLAPGITDNGAGLTAMLAMAGALQAAKITPELDLCFAGTVGEEGEGNLRGMRELFSAQDFARRCAAVLALDGAGSDTAVLQALGSRRYAVKIEGPGGHAWSDARRPNPIVSLGRIIAALAEAELPDDPRTTFNFGTIAGGTSVNSIPLAAEVSVDIRSTSAEEIIRQEVRLHRAVEDEVLRANAHLPRGQSRANLRWSIETTGERPSAPQPADSLLRDVLRAADRHLQIRTRTRTASTDANIPLALGIEAASLGGGGNGGGTHTLDEWFDPSGRDLALRRVLLIALALCRLQAKDGKS